MKAIVCVDKFGGIGNKGQLLFHIKKDMQRFKLLTAGKVVVMGRSTYESLPHGALPNRINIVLSRTKIINDDNVITLPDIVSLKQFIKEKGLKENGIWVIGGESIYQQLMPECTELWVTRVNKVEKCDKYFPDPLFEKDWQMKSIEHGEEDGLKFTFEVFEPSSAILQENTL